MRMLAKSNKSKRGFTLIELMVVVIIVGILAAAAVPLYNFARSRAYASEGKAAIGTIRSAELVFKLEDPAGLYRTGSQGGTSVDTLLDDLGIDVDTNTWWTETNAYFSVGPNDPVDDNASITTYKSPDASTSTFIYASGETAGTKIAGIKLYMSMESGNWYEIWP